LRRATIAAATAAFHALVNSVAALFAAAATQIGRTKKNSIKTKNQKKRRIIVSTFLWQRGRGKIKKFEIENRPSSLAQ